MRSAEGCGWLELARTSFCRLLGVVRRDRLAFGVVVTLLVIDLAWTAWFGVAKALSLSGLNERLYDLKYLRITAEGGYPELFNYGQTFVVVLLIGRLALLTRQPIHVALTLVFAVVLIDDSLAVHERVGKFFVRTLDLQPMLGLPPQDIGEVLTWAIMGLLVVPIILAGVLRSRQPHLGNGLAMLLTFGLILFCGIFVDQIYAILWEVFPGAGILLDMLEDGGEMVAITTAGALALGASIEQRDAAAAS